MGIATETAIVLAKRTVSVRMTATKMAREVGGTKATTTGTGMKTRRR